MRTPRRPLALLLLASLLSQPLALAATPGVKPLDEAATKRQLLPPAAIGWGNLLVPGLGATLSDHPWQGMAEAGLEIGSFYGGTLLATERRFKIDGSIEIPDSGHVAKPATAAILQQFGLKYHFYNTFYHYQQAVLAREEAGYHDDNPQPIYRGNWKDMLVAPFKWENLASPWTWPIVAGVSAYLVWDFSRTGIQKRTTGLSASDQALFGASEIAVVPVGSSFGGDPLFRGFIQREVYGMTGSLPVAIVAQTALFSLLHSDHLTSAGVGLYFGIEANALKGDLGPMMAAHFWINVVIGVLEYWTLKGSLGHGVPFTPPVNAQVTIPF